MKPLNRMVRMGRHGLRYPGQGFEQHVESIVAGGDLLGYKAEKKKQDPRPRRRWSTPLAVGQNEWYHFGW